MVISTERKEMRERHYTQQPTAVKDADSLQEDGIKYPSKIWALKFYFKILNTA